jgi:hypothetical protein
MNVSRKTIPVRPLSSLKLPPDTLRELRGVAAAATTAAVSSTLLLTGSKVSTAAAAEALAHETGRELVRVDTAQIGSRSIEETERDLDRLFATVDPASSILFFDEADALFGKRTSVEESHDRYAGVELSWFLERLESFPTLAIFARRSHDEPPSSCHFWNDIRLPR